MDRKNKYPVDRFQTGKLKSFAGFFMGRKILSLMGKLNILPDSLILVKDSSFFDRGFDYE
jgi:hypothetical protein